MTGKRKRKRPGNATESQEKRQKTSTSISNTSLAAPKDSVIKQALLTQFYSGVFTLREYLLSKLPSTSKIRRKKILNIGRSRSPGEDGDQRISSFIDKTLVGVLPQSDGSKEDRRQQWENLSQKADDSMSSIDSKAVGKISLSEIINKSIWMLFSKCHGRNQHLLCQGYQKDINSRMINQGQGHTSAIPGVISTYPNSHVTSMRSKPWPQILLLLGTGGENVIADLIMDCGVFIETEAGHGVYHQLSGIPLGELRILPKNFANDSKAQLPVPKNGATSGNVIKPLVHNPSSIVFVRSRMLYSRAELNAQGGVRFGLRHIHVLNRYELEPNDSQPGKISQGEPSLDPSTVHFMVYLFPRQFGLHNVFTSEVDHRQTVQPYKDYTLREDEIFEKYSGPTIPKIPKRLRGKTAKLVRKFQVQHRRCAYKKLLEHYCPVNAAAASVFPLPPTQSQKSKGASAIFKTQITISTASEIAGTKDVPPPKPPSMMDYATPIPLVSAFCRSVLSNIIPREFWGTGETQVKNERRFLLNVDRFIELRRFESFSLHEATQGLQISNIEWLQPPSCTANKPSQSDTKKRLEIFQEFLYYTIDSLLIPLIRANFYVTESNIHRYRLFYFRHDVWKSLADPAMTSLKLDMFEEVKLEQAQKLLQSRNLGFSQVRLLPKESGIRPIMNLKRRVVKKGTKNLGASINSLLTPVYNALCYEKQTNPARLGSTMFSVSDLYTRTKTFKSRLLSQNHAPKPLYFVKIDVQSAFDTIPQSAILALMATVPTEAEYRLTKHFEIKPGEGRDSLFHSGKPVRAWKATAKAEDDYTSFAETLGEMGEGRRNTVFVENVVVQMRATKGLLTLLKEHVSRNMVKIGKRYYRQKEGIPQGSILSSLLCNYFYADLEAKHLGFLKEGGESLLLRLIDDFLLVTTDRGKAKRFLDVMHAGIGEYGVKCHPGKSLVNFEVWSRGEKVRRVVGGEGFPFVGCLVGMKDLEISRDRGRRKEFAIVDSLTVEFSKTPGRSFHRKVLNSFKIQAHAMFLDTAFNSTPTVLSNVHSAFIESATKMWTYAKCLPVGKQPGTKLLIKTITDLIELAFILMKSKERNKRNVGFKCVVRKVWVEWLAINAFRTVLGRRQSRYGKVIEWLDGKTSELARKERKSCGFLRGAIGKFEN